MLARNKNDTKVPRGIWIRPTTLWAQNNSRGKKGETRGTICKQTFQLFRLKFGSCVVKPPLLSREHRKRKSSKGEVYEIRKQIRKATFLNGSNELNGSSTSIGRIHLLSVDPISPGKISPTSRSEIFDERQLARVTRKVDRRRDGDTQVNFGLPHLGF